MKLAQIIAVALALFGAAAVVDAQCGKTSPYVGFTGPLTTIDHMVRSMTDQCSKTLPVMCGMSWSTLQT